MLVVRLITGVFAHRAAPSAMGAVLAVLCRYSASLGREPAGPVGPVAPVGPNTLSSE